MKIIFPITMSLSGGKYKEQITDLAIMGKAFEALSGSANYITIEPQDYARYCFLQKKDMWSSLIEIINDGGELQELEAFLLVDDSVLDTVVPQGVRDADGQLTFRNWNGGDSNPIASSTNGTKHILRTNLHYYSVTNEELKIFYVIPDVTLLADFQVEVLKQTPDFLGI